MHTVSRRVIRRILGRRNPPVTESSEILERLERDKERIHRWREENIDKIEKWEIAREKIDLLEKKLDLIEKEVSAGINSQEIDILEHDIGVLENQISNLEIKGFPEIDPHEEIDILDRLDKIVDEIDITLKKWDRLVKIDVAEQIKKKAEKAKIKVDMGKKKYDLVKNNMLGLIKAGKLGKLDEITDKKLYRMLPAFYTGISRFLKIPENQIRLSDEEEARLIGEVLAGISSWKQKEKDKQDNKGDKSGQGSQR